MEWWQWVVLAAVCAVPLMSLSGSLRDFGRGVSIRLTFADKSVVEFTGLPRSGDAPGDAAALLKSIRKAMSDEP